MTTTFSVPLLIHPWSSIIVEETTPQMRVALTNVTMFNKPLGAIGFLPVFASSEDATKWCRANGFPLPIATFDLADPQPPVCEDSLDSEQTP